MNTYSVRAAPLEQLIAELEQFAVDRERVGKHERAAGARAAAGKLAAGEEIVFFERCYYEVGETKRRGVMRRTRGDLIAELHDASNGWAHNGKDLLAFEARAAAGQIAAGADRVEVGHLAWEVIETPPTPAGTAHQVSGSRAQIVAALREYGEKWASRFDRGQEADVHQAITDIEQGATRVQVGHIDYEVADNA